jgi:hypothetical protein
MNDDHIEQNGRKSPLRVSSIQRSGKVSQIFFGPVANGHVNALRCEFSFWSWNLWPLVVKVFLLCSFCYYQ